MSSENMERGGDGLLSVIPMGLSPRLSTSVSNFRKPSMSVISSSNVLNSYEMASRSPSLVQTFAVGTVHAAIREHNHDLLQELLVQLGCNVESPEPGPFGKRPLHVAAEVNNVRATILLLEYKANPLAPQTCFYAKTPIHVAAASGSLDVLTYYLEDVQVYGQRRLAGLTDNQGQTPLHWAVQRNHLGCARVLMEHAASIRQTQGYGTSVLHTACTQGSLEMLKLMEELSPGHFRISLTGERDSERIAPLHRAALLDQPELIHFLVQKGAPVNIFDKEGRTPLDYAFSRSAWRTAAALLRHGADPFAVDPIHGRTALHKAAIAGQNVAHCKAFVDLLRRNPGLQGHMNTLDERGFTALHYAVLSEDLTVVQGLLQMGADMTTKGKKDKTVLHYASKKHGSLEMVETLLKSARNPADALRSVDQHGQKALHVAAENGHHEIVEFFIINGATSTADDYGQTPLHLAAAKNHYVVLKVLVDNHGSLLNHIDLKGQTALHLAAAKDAARAVVYLLSVGAISKADGSGRTPLELAIYHKNETAGLAFVNSVHWKSLVSQQSKDYGTVAQGLVEQLPQVMKACLDRCIEKQTDDVTGEPFVTYDFSLLQSLGKDDAKSFGIRYSESPMTVLKAMSHKKRNDLLSHPVCRTLLERKWISYGLYCSLLILLFNMLYVALLSLVVVRSVEEELRPHLLNMSYTNVAKYKPNALLDRDFIQMNETIHAAARDGYDGTWLVVVLVMALLIILMKELMDFASDGRRYFLDWTNYIQVFLFFFSLAFVICLHDDNQQTDFQGHHHVGQYTFQFGACAVFLAWVNLLRFCRPFGTFGIYSFMFFTIFKTLVQVAFFFFILTAAFTVSFFTVFNTDIYPDNADFYDEAKTLDTADLDTAFHYIPTSGMRIATLMLGDLEAVERFLTPFLEGRLPYPFLSFLFYGVCLIMMPVLLNNLLMGLSLGDLAEVRRNAKVLRLKMQISLHESLEKLFPTRWLKKIHAKADSYRFYPGRRLDMATWLARWTSGENAPTIVGESLNPDDETVSAAAKDKNELVQIRRRMQEVDGNVAEIRQLLVQALHNLDLKSSPSPPTPTIAVDASHVTLL